MSHQVMGALALSLLLSACGGGQSTTPAPVVVVPNCSALVASDAPLKNIGEIQGASDTSALVAQKVTARGVVVGGFQKLSDTVTQLNGFFIQQAIPDADPATSEGIFVYAPDATKLNPGDFVQVSGTVSEFGTEGSTVTQIGGTVTLSLCGSGVTIAPTAIALPVANASALERYEGMLVEMNQPQPAACVPLAQRFFRQMGLTGNEVAPSVFAQLAAASKGSMREFGTAVATLGMGLGWPIT